MNRSIAALAVLASALATISSASAMGRGRVEGPKKTVAVVLSAIQNDKHESVTQYLSGKALEQYGTTTREASELKSQLDGAVLRGMKTTLVTSNEGMGFRTYTVDVSAIRFGAKISASVNCRVSTEVLRQCTAEGPIFNPSETYGPYPRGQREYCRPVMYDTETCEVSDLAILN